MIVYKEVEGKFLKLFNILNIKHFDEKELINIKHFNNFYTSVLLNFRIKFYF